MSRLIYVGESRHPVWIDDEFLHNVVKEQDSKEIAPGVPKREETPFCKVLELNLDFRKILRIQCLWEFTALRKLELNSNYIEKIEGLDKLVNLTWLDLSSNKIEKIEGLESLLKLELLDLSYNNITVIENMDTFENLTHFLISNNRLEHLDKVCYLRKFKKLFSISIFGNPFSEKDDYKFFIAVYFPMLSFLDNQLLDKKTKDEACIRYAHVLDEMKREELQFQKAEEAEKKLKAEAKLLSDSFVEHFKGSQLFKDMVKDDPEAETLRSLPEVADLLKTFEQQMGELCVQIYEVGLAEHKLRQAEVDSFFSSQTEAFADYRQKSSQMCTTFGQKHNEWIAELNQASNPEKMKDKISDYNGEIDQFCNSLMGLTFHLVSQLEGIIKKFDNSISDMIGNFIETVQGLLVQCRDLEDEYYEKMQETALAALESVANNNEEDLSDDEITPFIDRDTVMDALTAGHENHLQKINDRETELVERVNAWKVALIKGIQDKEIKQRSTYIADINRYVDYLRKQLDVLE